MNSQLLRGFYLEDILVEPLEGQVTGRSGPEHLPPKAAEVLVRLASEPRSLVTHETLLASVWGDGKGSREALSHAVSEIRHALGDSADHPRFIQTLPRRGYRLIVEPALAPERTPTVPAIAGNASADYDIGFLRSLTRRGVLETGLAYLVLGWLIIQVADVVFDQLLLPHWIGTFVTVLVIAGFPVALILSWFLEFRDGRAVLDTTTSLRTRERRLTRTYLSIVGALIVASIGVFTYDRYVGLPAQKPAPSVASEEEDELLRIERSSIAVLPFLNIDGSERTQIFASGLAEDVIDRLARIPGLAVASRGDSWTLAPNSSSDQVRRRLRVSFYLEGSVRVTDDVLRVVVQLIDSETGFHIVSRGFDRELEDFMQVQRDITNLTVASLRVALPAETQLTLDPDNDVAELDAYILYQRGREIYERPQTLASLAEAIDFFDQALSIDQGYAAAHAGLCNAFVALYGLSNSADDIGRAESACSAALSWNPNLHMVYTALGNLYRQIDRVADAESAYEKALKINSRDVQAMSGLASIYRQRKDVDRAEAMLHSAIETEPGNWRTINSLGSFLFSLGRYAEAAATLRQVVFLDQENSQALGNLGSALMMLGNFADAKSAFEEALRIQPLGRSYSNLGIVYYYLGSFDESVEAHRKAVSLNPQSGLMWLNLADALYFADRREEADEAFSRATDISESRLSVNPSDARSLFALAWAQFMQGGGAEAQELLGRARSVAPGDPYGFYYDALMKTLSGDHAAAVAALRTAVDMGYPVQMLAAEPYLTALHSNAKFRALIRNRK